MPKQEMEEYYRPGTTEPEYRPKGTAAAEEAAKAAAAEPAEPVDADGVITGDLSEEAERPKATKKAARKK